MLIVQQAARALQVERLLPRRSVLCITICLSLLTPCGSAYADNSPQGQVGRDCKRAAQAFKDGIVAFERKDWVTAEYHMLTALEFDCDKDLSVTVPYGRWRYRYQPSIYLGLALHRLAQCLKEGGETCSVTRADWKGDWDDYLARRLGELGSDWQKAKVIEGGLQSRCQQARARFGPPACCVEGGCFVLLRTSKAPYYPVIDWWSKLDDASAGVALEQTAGEGCDEVTTPLEWFWLGKAKDSNARICKELGQELAFLKKACPQ